MAESSVHVTNIIVYPVKSSAAHRLKKSTVLPAGLRHDRRFVVVDTLGKVITGRENPKLLNILCDFDEENLILKALNFKDLTLKLEQTEKELADIRLFDNSLKASTIDHACDEWISGVLGQESKLLTISKSEPRTMKPSHGARDDDEVFFADSSPVHLVSQESVADLNSRLARHITFDRFRPNIVVKGALPYQEDYWTSIKINDCEFEVNRKCKRCVFTTIDPATGQKDPDQEPLRTLSGYRGVNGGVAFGIYLIPRKTGSIHIGDEVRITSASRQGLPG